MCWVYVRRFVHPRAGIPHSSPVESDFQSRRLRLLPRTRSICILSALLRQLHRSRKSGMAEGRGRSNLRVTSEWYVGYLSRCGRRTGIVIVSSVSNLCVHWVHGDSLDPVPCQLKARRAKYTQTYRTNKSRGDGSEGFGSSFSQRFSIGPYLSTPNAFIFPMYTMILLTGDCFVRDSFSVYSVYGMTSCECNYLLYLFIEDSQVFWNIGLLRTIKGNSVRRWLLCTVDDTNPTSGCIPQHRTGNDRLVACFEAKLELEVLYCSVLFTFRKMKPIHKQGLPPGVSRGVPSDSLKVSYSGNCGKSTTPHTQDIARSNHSVCWTTTGTSWSSGMSAPIICVWLRTVDGAVRAPRKS